MKNEFKPGVLVRLNEFCKPEDVYAEIVDSNEAKTKSGAGRAITFVNPNSIMLVLDVPNAWRAKAFCNVLKKIVYIVSSCFVKII